MYALNHERWFPTHVVRRYRGGLRYITVACLRQDGCLYERIARLGGDEVYYDEHWIGDIIMKNGEWKRSSTSHGRMEIVSVKTQKVYEL